MKGNELKQRRKALGLTQTEFGKKLDLANTTILRHEKSVNDVPKYLEHALDSLEAAQLREVRAREEAK